MTQPNALFLADILEDAGKPADITDAAAAELRRLHEAHDWQYRMAGERLRRVEKLERQRDALLEALRPFVTIGIGFDMEDVRKARAAIKAAEENT